MAGRGSILPAVSWPKTGCASALLYAHEVRQEHSSRSLDRQGDRQMGRFQGLTECSIMGVLNVTPDSFSDGGRWASVDRAVEHGRAMFEAGAQMVDVGGESTRPGATPVESQQELGRVLPVVRELSSYGIVSIDTRHAEVAVACVNAGATIINDVSAELGGIAAELDVGWVAMHMQGIPRTMQSKPSYQDVTTEVLGYLLARARRARSAGAPTVWIDPGIGFGKTTAQNLTLLRDLDRFTATDFPVLVGASRKSFIGDLGVPAGPSQRLGGSVAVAVLSALAGVAVVRVHDVDETTQALRVLRAITA